MLDDLFPPSTRLALTAEERPMQAAIAEARHALGRVAPNPAVGAVIVRDGEVVGRGATSPPPGPHAEINALRHAGDQAVGADLFVTLEPCCHYGNTPPCTDAIVDAGIRRVIVGATDPNPDVNGRGIQLLRDHGIEVVTGCMESDCLELVKGFASRVLRGRPRAIAKYAMTLDGKIATRTGHSRWISGAEAREIAHVLRDRIDAIMIGSNTIAIDNPRLTTRISNNVTGYGGAHHPLRIVIDSKLRTAPDAAILTRGMGQSPLIYCASDAPRHAERELLKTGATVLRVDAFNGHADLQQVFQDLGKRGINELLVEGGGGLIGALLDVGLIDEVLAFIAPVIVGGDGPPPVAGKGVATMPEAWRIQAQRLRQLGDELMLNGHIVYPGADHV